jgi:hypothetical protein
VLAYAKAMAAGSVFPPVIVYRDGEGTLWLADGFTRVAARRKLGLKTARAVIREGSVEDAILGGIEANFNPYHSRKVEDADRNHAVEMLIRCESTRNLSDSEMGRRCGRGPGFVAQSRLRMRDRFGIPLPEQVRYVVGKKTRFRKYKPLQYGLPSVVGNGPRDANGPRGYCAKVDGSTVYLGGDKSKAEAHIREIAGERQGTREVLVNHRFRAWLGARGFFMEPIPSTEFCLVGFRISGTPVFPVCSHDMAGLTKEICRCFAFMKATGYSGRIIVVAYLSDSGRDGQFLANTFSSGDQPIEFLTPEQLLAEFAPEPDAAGAPPADGEAPPCDA